MFKKRNIGISIGTKLLLGVVFLVLILGAFGMYLAGTLNNVRSSFSDLDSRYDALRQITSLEHVNAILTDATKSYVLTGDPRWEDIYDQASLEFDLRAQELSRLITGTGQEELFAQFIEHSDDLRAIELLILSKVREGDFERANELFDVEYQQKQLEALDILNAIRLEMESSLSEIIQRNRVVILFSENVLVAFLIALIILITVIALAVSYLIASSLRELRDTVEGIMDGDLSKRARVRSHDEIGQLAVAFNHMTAKLEDSYHDLEEKVEEKTKELRHNVREVQDTNEELEQSKAALISVMEDLKAEKRRLAHAKARDEAILSSIGDGMIMIDAQGVILRVNQQAARLLDMKQGEYKGKRFLDIVPAYEDEKLVHEHDRPMTRALVEKEKITSNNFEFETRRGGRIAVSITATPVSLDGEIIGAVIVFRDISHEKAVDKAKTEFVSLASHQLKAPLTSIKWNSQMLLEEDLGQLSGDQKEVLRNLYESNEHMIDLVNALLNISRIELGTFVIEPERTDLREVTDSVLEEQEAAIEEKHLRVRTDYPKMLAPVSVDPNLTRIIFQNLISNAVKYTPDGGSIAVSIAKDSGEIIFAVKDTGYGIPESEQHRIFEKMFRSSNVRDVNGNGLGLYVVKEIMEASGGRVWFESEEGEGSTFYAAIPESGMKPKEGTKKLS